MTNPADLIALYRSGVSVLQCSKRFGIDQDRCRATLVENGVTIRDRAQASAANHATRFRNIFTEVLPHYDAGLSVKAIHEKTGYARSTIKRALEAGGVTPRNRSEAMFHRMANTTPEERLKLAEKAHAAIRAKGSEFFHRTALKQAVTKERTMSKVGQGEEFFADSIGQLGISYIPQKAVGAYNVDILVGNLAVEIHRCSVHPHNESRYRKRLEFLLDCGLDVLYIETLSREITRAATEYTISFLQESGENPTTTSQYRMIRGDGELIATGHFDLHHGALVMTSG